MITWVEDSRDSITHARESARIRTALVPAPHSAPHSSSRTARDDYPRFTSTSSPRRTFPVSCFPHACTLSTQMTTAAPVTAAVMEHDDVTEAGLTYLRNHDFIVIEGVADYKESAVQIAASSSIRTAFLVTSERTRILGHDFSTNVGYVFIRYSVGGTYIDTVVPPRRLRGKFVERLHAKVLELS